VTEVASTTTTTEPVTEVASTTTTTEPVTEVASTTTTTETVTETTSTTVSKISNDIAQFLYDEMHLAHEGYPHGVPSSYNWYASSLLKNAVDEYSEGFKAWTGWGQVYEAEEGNPATNVRVELKNYQAYYLDTNGVWHEIITVENINEGAGYTEDYQGDITSSDPNITRFESNGHMAVLVGNGYNFHFYTPRMPVPQYGVVQVVSSFDARIIIDDVQGIDDRDKAKII